MVYATGLSTPIALLIDSDVLKNTSARHRFNITFTYLLTYLLTWMDKVSLNKQP